MSSELTLETKDEVVTGDEETDVVTGDEVVKADEVVEADTETDEVNVNVKLEVNKIESTFVVNDNELENELMEAKKKAFWSPNFVENQITNSIRQQRQQQGQQGRFGRPKRRVRRQRVTMVFE